MHTIHRKQIIEKQFFLDPLFLLGISPSDPETSVESRDELVVDFAVGQADVGLRQIPVDGLPFELLGGVQTEAVAVAAVVRTATVSYTHLTLPTIYSV